MKCILKNIMISSVLTMILYLLFAVGLFGGIENQEVRFFAISFMTVNVYAVLLFYIHKYRGGICENEMLADYENESYQPKREISLIFQREKHLIFCIFCIVLICFLANLIDEYLFKTKVLSLITTMLFVSVTMLSSVIDIPFLGYFLSGFYVCTVYLILIFLYRKKRYAYWMKK